MKIAFIISNKETMSLGECLSSAAFFYVYDTSIKSYYELAHPFVDEKHQMSQVLSNFLFKGNIEIVVGKDLGPKAKAAIEEKGMRWYIEDSKYSIEDIIKVIIKKP